jgi:hypothetical protein
MAFQRRDSMVSADYRRQSPRRRDTPAQFLKPSFKNQLASKRVRDSAAFFRINGSMIKAAFAHAIVQIGDLGTESGSGFAYVMNACDPGGE